MAYFVVQQWWAFPNIGQVLQMGDGPSPHGFPPAGREGNPQSPGGNDGRGQAGFGFAHGESSRAGGRPLPLRDA